MRPIDKQNQADTRVRNLADIRPGKQVQLVDIDAGRNLNSRLLALGLIRGTHINVITNQGQGPLLIGLGESRMTIGRGMARKIMVR